MRKNRFSFQLAGTYERRAEPNQTETEPYKPCNSHRLASHYYKTKLGLRHLKMSNENKNLSIRLIQFGNRHAAAAVATAAARQTMCEYEL